MAVLGKDYWYENGEVLSLVMLRITLGKASNVANTDKGSLKHCLYCDSEKGGLLLWQRDNH